MGGFLERDRLIGTSNPPKTVIQCRDVGGDHKRSRGQFRKFTTALFTLSIVSDTEYPKNSTEIRDRNDEYETEDMEEKIDVHSPC